MLLTIRHLFPCQFMWTWYYDSAICPTKAWVVRCWPQFVHLCPCQSIHVHETTHVICCLVLTAMRHLFHNSTLKSLSIHVWTRYHNHDICQKLQVGCCWSHCHIRARAMHVNGNSIIIPYAVLCWSQWYICALCNSFEWDIVAMPSGYLRKMCWNARYA